MSVGNVVVSQEAPAKNHLWIQPKGAARFWNGSVWKMISGGGGGGGGDDYYTKAQADERFYLNSNINGVSGYAAKFSGTRTLTYASDYIRIGDGIIYWDSVNGGFRIYHSDLLTDPQSTSKAGVYADWVSALGANNQSGPGGGGIDWEHLTFSNGEVDPTKIMLKDPDDTSGTAKTPEFTVPYATSASNDGNGNNIINTYLSKTEALNTYLSIAFFERLFQAYNNTTIVHPNDTTSTIDNIKAMFGFWTEQYVSALGQNGSSGGGGGFDWDMLITYDGDSSHVINSLYLPDLYLPLTGGTITGVLQVNSIEATNGNGMLVYKPDSGWGGISNTQWGLGTQDAQGVIRSNDNDLLHYKNGTAYTILDTSNSSAIGLGTANYLAYYSTTSDITGATVNQNYYVGGPLNVSGNILVGNTSEASHVISLQSSASQLRMFAYSDGNCYIEGGNSDFSGNTASALMYIAGQNASNLSVLHLRANETECRGLLKTTVNGNTTTFGSQNASWCHIYNSADVPFIFNKSICSAGNNIDAGSALGSYNYPWHVLYLGGTTSATMGNTTTNPRIVFFESNTTPGDSSYTQAVALTYTDYDSYRASKGLKIHDADGIDPGNVWLEVEGSIYTNYNLCINQTSGTGYGISLYGNNNTSSYGIAFAQTNSTGYNLKFGDVTGDWATYFNTAYGATRGWIFRADTGAAASLSTRGNFCAKGGVTALVATSSDRRLKKSIKQFNASNIIDKLNPVKFEWNSKAKKYNCNFKEGTNYGLIAQDSDGIIDDFVFDLPDGSGYKGVRYEKLIPILLQAIKEQNEKIENLEYEINVLKGIYK